MNLATPSSVQKLQTALHDKAKESAGFRFYALYDKMYRKDVLAFAYQCCKANGGAAGVDSQSFEDIEEYGVRAMVGRTGGRTEESNLSTATGKTGVDPQAGRQAAAVRSTRYPGSDGGQTAAVLVTRTDFRGRSAAGTVRLSTGPQCTGRRKTRP